MKEAYPSEHDLFYAKAALDMLVRSKEIGKSEVFLKAGIERCGETPTLDMV